MSRLGVGACSLQPRPHAYASHPPLPRAPPLRRRSRRGVEAARGQRHLPPVPLPGGDGPAVHADTFATSVHAQNGVGCTDCHAGYTEEHAMGGTLPPLSDADQQLVARLEKAPGSRGEKKVHVTSPRAYLACQSCHTEQTGAFATSIHAKWLREDTKVSGATCASCHGSPHAVKALAFYDPKGEARQPVPEDRREMTRAVRVVPRERGVHEGGRPRTPRRRSPTTTRSTAGSPAWATPTRRRA